MYSHDELFSCSLECYFGVYFPRCFATRDQEINTKITFSWLRKKVRHLSPYIIPNVHRNFILWDLLYNGI